MPEFKDYVAALAVAVSAASAGFSYYANTRAGEANARANEANAKANAVKVDLVQSRFSADTSIKLLELTYTTLATADTPPKKIAACTYASTLAQVEEHTFKEREPLIRAFLGRMIAGDDIDNNCRVVMAEALGSEGQAESAPAVESTPPDGPGPAPTPGPQPTPTPGLGSGPEDPVGAESPIGVWHAVIASYDITEKGCTFAKADVNAFKPLLLGDQFGGATLGVYKTAHSNVYAVSVDFGDDKTRARNAVQAIREIGAERPTKEGADSFVQQNRGWIIDTACDEHVQL